MVASGDDDADASGDRTADAGGAGSTDAPDDEPAGRPCPVCETPMYHRHCKYVCPQHGVVYDCADTFY